MGNLTPEVGCVKRRTGSHGFHRSMRITGVERSRACFTATLAGAPKPMLSRLLPQQRRE